MKTGGLLIGPPLGWALPFEVLHALLKLVVLLLEVAVRAAYEGVRVVELAVEIFAFLHVLNLNVHREPLSHELNLTAEALDQHPGVPLDLIETIVMRIQPLLNPLKALIHPLKPLIDLLKPLIDPIEPHVECLKPPVKVLNEFLVHAASVTSEG